MQLITTAQKVAVEEDHWQRISVVGWASHTQPVIIIGIRLFSNTSISSTSVVPSPRYLSADQLVPGNTRSI